MKFGADDNHSALTSKGKYKVKKRNNVIKKDHQDK